jgi:hypothetical protein
MKCISSRSFLEAFKIQWCADEASNSFEFQLACNDRTRWTHYVLDQSGLLARTMASFQARVPGLLYDREWYTVDAVYYVDHHEALHDRTHPVRSEVHALIEHEHDVDVEKEMWKLLHWRAPLKILMFTDYSEDERRANPRYRCWLGEKLAQLDRMIDVAAQFFQENVDTEYLFLVAAWKASNLGIQWRFATRRAADERMSLLAAV